MKQAKCPSCGANIEINENLEAGICPYCKSAYSTEKALNCTMPVSNNANTINNYYSNSIPQNSNLRVPKSPRPTVNIGIAILGFLFYIFPGIIYIGYVKQKQKEWDDKYTY